MLDFAAVRNEEKSYDELVAPLTKADLYDLTNEMVDRMLELVADATDADVTFVPDDPNANDTFAIDETETDLAWTLGHVIVHTTASAEEAAFLAAEMARGVEPHGRSRSEVPWRSVTTIAQCRERLEESRQMRLTLLEVWPQQPYLELRYQPRPNAPEINAIGRFCTGLRHDDSHLGQIEEVARQAQAARKGVEA